MTPADEDAARRQALKKINSALTTIRRWMNEDPDPFYSPHGTGLHMLHCVIDDLTRSYDLLAGLVEPDDLLDEMANL